MKQLNNNIKQIKAGGIFGYGGWGFATMANVLINGAVGIVSNSLNIANSAKHSSNQPNYVYKPTLSTKFNLFN